MLRCRKDDVPLVESVLHSASEEYAHKSKVHKPEIIVDSVHLPPAPSDDDVHSRHWYIPLFTHGS